MVNESNGIDGGWERVAAMDLTSDEKDEIKRLIDADRPLPAKYRLRLFADAPETELIWKGKSGEVTSAVLPFQSIEQIDEPRAKAGEYAKSSLFDVNEATGRQSGGWTNKLIWGDNKLVLSSLKNGPLRREIAKAGDLKLIYIDPPFDVGAHFSVVIEVGDCETLTKELGRKTKPCRQHPGNLRSLSHLRRIITDAT